MHALGFHLTTVLKKNVNESTVTERSGFVYRWDKIGEGLQKVITKLSGVMETFVILILMMISWVYTYIHPSGNIRDNNNKLS